MSEIRKVTVVCGEGIVKYTLTKETNELTVYVNDGLDFAPEDAMETTIEKFNKSWSMVFDPEECVVCGKFVGDICWECA